MSEHQNDARQILGAEELAWLRDRPDIVGRAAADAAHTAMEAMRREQVLASWIRTNTEMILMCDDGYADATHVSADGLIHRSTDAPAGSVRVVP